MEYDKCVSVLDGAIMRCIDYVMNSFWEEILSGKRSGILKEKAFGEVTRRFDAEIESIFIKEMEKTGIPLRIDSEEVGLVEFGNDPSFLVIIDPFDGSDMAARGYPLCSVAASIVDIETGLAVASRIEEFSSKTQFSAIGNRASHSSREIRPSDVKAFDEAFIVSYGAKRERIAALSELIPILSGCQLYLNYGGPLDIAKIATGQVDVFIELTKGMEARDTLPGMHILEKAGGVILSPDGEKIDGTRFIPGRQKFIAASNKTLADVVVAKIHEHL